MAIKHHLCSRSFSVVSFATRSNAPYRKVNTVMVGLRSKKAKTTLLYRNKNEQTPIDASIIASIVRSISKGRRRGSPISVHGSTVIHSIPYRKRSSALYFAVCVAAETLMDFGRLICMKFQRATTFRFDVNPCYPHSSLADIDFGAFGLPIFR